MSEPPAIGEKIARHKFGSSYGDDMVSLYVSWKFGEDWTRKNYCGNIPNINGLNMSFFEKYNPENMKTLDPLLSRSVSKKIEEIGIPPATRKDLSSIEIAIKLRETFIKTSRLGL